MTAAFDAEAELHARIWNSFTNETDEDADKYIINADSITQLKTSTKLEVQPYLTTEELDYDFN